MNSDRITIQSLKTNGDKRSSCLKPLAGLKLCDVYPLNLIAIVVVVIYLMING